MAKRTLGEIKQLDRGEGPRGKGGKIPRCGLCGHHYAEDHEGRWQECQQCRELFETEMYVYFGTNEYNNEYNFEKLTNPPKYEPTHCQGCNRVIRLAYDGYSYGPEGYLCEKCSNKKLGNLR